MSDLRGVLIPTVPDSKVTTLTTESQWMWQSSVEDVWDMRGVSKTPQIMLYRNVCTAYNKPGWFSLEKMEFPTLSYKFSQ